MTHIAIQIMGGYNTFRLTTYNLLNANGLQNNSNKNIV